MPFELHDDLTTPPDETVLWRYMDFAQFIQMIETEALWFLRLDQFEDPLEATLTNAEMDSIESIYQKSTGLLRTNAGKYGDIPDWMRKTTFISCWRAGISESLAMWDLYGKKGNGTVAVKSSIGILKDELSATNGAIRIAQINYIDWESEALSHHPLQLCARKEKSYEHEAEVRAIILLQDDESWADEIADKTTHVIQIPINVRKVIKEVVVGPRERPWVTTLVKDVMRRYGLQMPVNVSNKLTRRLKGPVSNCLGPTK
jgi:hypothetical protein